MWIIYFCLLYLVVASVLVQQRYDGLDVTSLDDVEGLGALDQNAVQHLQYACTVTKASISQERQTGSACERHRRNT